MISIVILKVVYVLNKYPLNEKLSTNFYLKIKAIYEL